MIGHALYCIVEARQKGPTREPSLVDFHLEDKLLVGYAEFLSLHTSFGSSPRLKNGRAQHREFSRRRRPLIDDSTLLRLHVLHDIIFGRRLSICSGRNRCEGSSKYDAHCAFSLLLLRPFNAQTTAALRKNLPRVGTLNPASSYAIETEASCVPSSPLQFARSSVCIAGGHGQGPGSSVMRR